MWRLQKGLSIWKWACVLQMITALEMEKSLTNQGFVHKLGEVDFYIEKAWNGKSRSQPMKERICHWLEADLMRRFERASGS